MAYLQSLSNKSWLSSITSNPKRGFRCLGCCACFALLLVSLTWWRHDVKPFDKVLSTSTTSSAKVSLEIAPISLPDVEPTLDTAEPGSADAFPPLPPADDEEYVSLCLGIKDQPSDLEEFLVHYYYHHGIRRFYIIDDGSIPPLSYNANFGTPPFAVPRSALTFTYVPHTQDRPQPFQHIMYADYCVGRFGDRHTWMGFFDSDEFLEMRRHITLVNWLRQWENNDTVGAVSVNWLIHNSGGHHKRPHQDTRKSFGRCVVNFPEGKNARGENSALKTFAKIALFDGVDSVHHMRTADGTVSVGENGDECGIGRKPTHDTWALHHYAVKSREQFLEKQQRGSMNDHHAVDDFWDMIEGADDYDCPELSTYVP